MPVKKNPFTKWIVGGGAVAAILVSTYLLTLENEKSDTAEIKRDNQELENVNVTEINSDNQEYNISSEIKSPNISDLTDKNKDQSSDIKSEEKQQLIYSQNTNLEDKESSDKSVTIIDVNSDNIFGIRKGVVIPKETNPNIESVSLPSISDICIGEELNIEPIQGHTILVEDPNGNVFRISKSTDKFTANAEGQHLVWIDNALEVDYKSFNVKPSPKVDIEVVEKNIYENGIPTTKLSTNATSNNYLWEFEGYTASSVNKDVNAHYFKKGTYQAKLTIKNEFGCSHTAFQNITIDEDYNLLAVNGFDPMSNDSRKNIFIPFALTQRSVSFRMIIMDPKDGGIIFESEDASNPWTGIDSRTGQMVEPNKAYIWQVILNNPEPGEKSEYKGTIVRM